MPAYLLAFDIDWSWKELSASEQAIVRRHEALARADPTTHTLETLKQALAAASSDLPQRQIRAVAEDEHGAHALEASHGQCTESKGAAFNPAGRFPGDLKPSDYIAAGVRQLRVALYWPEGSLTAMEEQAHRLDASLSWLVQRALIAAKAPGTAPVAAGQFPRDGGRRKQGVYLPIEMYAELVETADREDRSMSSLVQAAMSSAWPLLTSLPSRDM